MSKKRRGNTPNNIDVKSLKTVNKRPLVLLVILVCACVAVYAIYRLLISLVNPEAVLFAYMGISTVCIFTYVIYNRGFSRKGITKDMLPDSWDEEKKNDFISDSEKRLKRSKPLLIAVISFFVTFIIEAITLIVVPFFLQFLGA